MKSRFVEIEGVVVGTPSISVNEKGRMARFLLSERMSGCNAKGELVYSLRCHNIVAFNSLATKVEECLSKGTSVNILAWNWQRIKTDEAGRKKEYNNLVIKDLSLFTFQKK